MKNICLIWLLMAASALICSNNVFGQSNEQLRVEIEALLQSGYTDSMPGAAVLVMNDHEMLFQGAYGLANLETNIPNEIHTIFRIGSMTKQFTAIAILMLVEEGKLQLDDHIDIYFPELFGGGPSVSIRQLLAHTAGIKDLQNIPEVRELMFAETRAYDLANIISQQELDFKPGESYNYSNSGYIILGALLEKISGLSYREFLQSRIFDPLDMSNTYFANIDDLPENIAMGYFNRPEKFADAPKINTSLLLSAGGIWSTVEDMAKWNEALYSETLLPADISQLAFQVNQLNTGKWTDYGLGFRRCEVNGMESIEHGGGIFGYNSYGIRIEEKGVYVIILSNFEGRNPYDQLAAQIAGMAIGRPYEEYASAISPLTDQLQELSGIYLTEWGDTLQVLVGEAEASIQQVGKSKQSLRLIEGTTFAVGDKVGDKMIFSPGHPTTLFWKPRRAMGVEAAKLDRSAE